MSTKAVSYVLLDKMKPTSAAHHAREGSGCSATTSESSFVEDLFNVWPHVVHEDEDGVKEYLAMLGGMPECDAMGKGSPDNHVRSMPERLCQP